MAIFWLIAQPPFNVYSLLSTPRLYPVSGLPYGPCWVAREGQGWLHGNADPLTGRLTGDEIAFVYPDLSTGKLLAKVHPKKSIVIVNNSRKE